MKKILSLLSSNNKKFFLLYILTVFLNIFLELFGIGVLLAFITSFLNNDYSTFRIFNLIDLNFSNHLSENFKLIFIGVLLFFILKNIIIFLINYFQFYFLKKIREQISLKLYSIYINLPYKSFFSYNSSIFLRNLNFPNIFQMYINNYISFYSEIVLLICLFLSLIHFSPASSLVSIIFFVTIAFLSYFPLKNKILNLGKLKQNLDPQIDRSIIESFLSIKEVKIYSKEDFFISEYFSKIKKITKIDFLINLIQSSPRLFFEISLVLFLVSSIFIFNELNFKKDKILEIVSAFAIIGIRSVPSLNKIIISKQKIKFFNPNINILLNEIKNLTFNKSFENQKIIKDFESIEIKNLNFSYSNKENIFKNLNFIIEKNKFFGIFGKSGSGKSTLINLITGLLSPDSGKILINKKIELKSVVKTFQNFVGYVSQNVFLLDDTIKKNICFEDDGSYNLEKLQNSIKLAQLEKFVNSLPERENTIVGENAIKLSGGQKQRLAIARALYKNPKILILDEATSQLDTETEEDLIESILNIKRNFNITIILISHNINLIKKCDSFINLNEN